jgi:AraC-like DNA-binding protein
VAVLVNDGHPGALAGPDQGRSWTSVRGKTIRRPGQLLYGYLKEPAGGPDETSDAIVVRSGDRVPTIVRAFHLGPIDCCLFEGEDVDVEPHHRAPAADGLVLGYVVSGRVSVTQRGHTVVLQPGMFTFYEGTAPYRIASSQRHRYLVLRVPLFRIGGEHYDRGAVAATDTSAHPSSAVLSALLGAIARREEPASLAAREHLGDAVAACVHAVLAESDQLAPSARSQSLFDQLVLWVEEHLAEPDLSAYTLARSHFLSPRYVRKVFAENGTTVSAYVRQRRLERVRNELLDPRQSSVKVSAIAARWGFGDPSVFSRAFARHFGESPQRYRQQHLDE